VNDYQVQFASAFFADMEDALLADGLVAQEQAEPAGALTRAANEEGWPDVVGLEEVVEEDEDEEDTSPGDIEEDPDDYPASDLAKLKAAAQEIQDED
jgi:alpha-D-ribose 1-methylphosphonate 5-triphosphate synthase subunit PhnI